MMKRITLGVLTVCALLGVFIFWSSSRDSYAAERETLEESGYEVHAEKVLAFLDKSRHEHPPSLDYTYKVLIGCRLDGGEPRPITPGSSRLSRTSMCGLNGSSISWSRVASSSNEMVLPDCFLILRVSI